MYHKEQLELLSAIALAGLVMSEHRGTPEIEAARAVSYGKALCDAIEAEFVVPYADTLAHLPDPHDTLPPSSAPAIELPKVSEATPAPSIQLDEPPAQS